MSLFPATDKTVAPWFQKYCQTITDPTTWRHMRSMVTKERDALAVLLPDYERAGFADIVAEVKEGLARCDDLLAKMDAKWAEIERERIA